MLILEENFRWHSEAFASKLFIYSSQHLKWFKTFNQSCPKTYIYIGYCSIYTVFILKQVRVTWCSYLKINGNEVIFYGAFS